MAQYVNKIDNTENVVSANVVSSATIVQSAAKVHSATSTIYTYDKDRQYIEGAAYVQVLSQEEFDALAKKDQNTFYFILDPDFSPVISTEDTTQFEAEALAIIGEVSEFSQ